MGEEAGVGPRTIGLVSCKQNVMEQRRNLRFVLHLPMLITRTGAQCVAVAARTENISSAGVLFTVEREPNLGDIIEYVITLNHEGTQPLNLRCIGKVLRAEWLPNRSETMAFRVAASMDRHEIVREPLGESR